MRVPLEWLKEYVQVGATAEEVAVKLTMGGLEVEGIEPKEEIVRRLLQDGCSAELAEAAAAQGPVLDVYVTPNRGDCLSMVGVAREIAALYDLPLTSPRFSEAENGGETAKQTSVTIEDPALCPRYAARLLHGVRVGPSPDWMQARLLAAGQRPINNIVDATNYVMLELGQPLHAFDLDTLAEGRIVVRQARAGEILRTLDDQDRALTPPMLVIADANKPVAVAGIMGGGDTEVSDNTKNILLESAHFDPLSVRRASRGLSLRTEASYRFERVVDPDGVARAANRVCDLLAQMGQAGVVAGIVDVYPQPREPKAVSLRVSRAAELLGIPEITQEVAVSCLNRLGLSVEYVQPLKSSIAPGKTITEGLTVTEEKVSEKPELLQTTSSSSTPAVEGTLAVIVPTFRPDLAIEEDLIEEVGRIYGYENIPETLPVGSTTRGGDSEEGQFLSQIRRLLVACGLQEVVTHSLRAPSAFDSAEDLARRVPIRNALSAEVSGLRRSLIPTLLDVAQRNAAHGTPELAIFEAGHVWQNEGEGGEIVPQEYIAVAGLLVGPLLPSGWQREIKPLPGDFFTLRGIVERLCEGLGASSATFTPLGERAPVLPQFHPGRAATLDFGEGRPAGVLGELHPGLAGQLGLRQRVYVFEISLDALRAAVPATGMRFRLLPRHPAVTRDLAPRVAESLPYSAIESAIQAAEIALLEEFRLTDIFRGAPLPEDVKSLTLSFTFRAPDRTLADAEVTAALAQLRSVLETRCEAVFPV